MLIWIKLYSCHPGEEVTPQSWPWSLTATERLQLLLASPVGPKAGQAHRLFIPTWHSSSLLCLKCFEWFGNTKDQFLKWFKFIGVPCLRCSQGWNGAEFEGGPLTWRAKKRLQTVLMCRECEGVQGVLGTALLKRLGTEWWSKTHRATGHPGGYIKASGADWIMVTAGAGSYPSSQYLTGRNAPWGDWCWSGWKTCSPM